MVLMQKTSVIDTPSGGVPEQAPRWDLVDTESCDGGIRVLAPFDIPFLRNPKIGKKNNNFGLGLWLIG